MLGHDAEPFDLRKNLVQPHASSNRDASDGQRLENSITSVERHAVEMVKLTQEARQCLRRAISCAGSR